MGTLDGCAAIVTGASRGIGKGCALELGAAGATVYATGRTLKEGDAPLPGSLEATVRDVEALGGRCVGVACDHRDDAQVAALFERVAAESGRLDVLVNNAFLIPPELTSGLPFWETPLSNWDDMIDVGTRSAYVATWHAARPMAGRQARPDREHQLVGRHRVRLARGLRRGQVLRHGRVALNVRRQRIPFQGGPAAQLSGAVSPLPHAEGRPQADGRHRGLPGLVEAKRPGHSVPGAPSRAALGSERTRCNSSSRCWPTTWATSGADWSCRRGSSAGRSRVSSNGW